MPLPNDHLASSAGDKWDNLSNPAKWASVALIKPPSWVNRRTYQRQINRIFTSASDDKPLVRLVWAWEAQEWKRGEIAQTYRAFTWRSPEGTRVDISPPRWVLETRIEPEQYLDAWHANRWIKDPDYTGPSSIVEMPSLSQLNAASLLTKIEGWIDVLGPPPPDGMYVFMHLICDHDPDLACCNKAWDAWKAKERKNPRCYGYYKDPDEKELSALRKGVAQSAQKGLKQSAHEPLNATTLATIFRRQEAWNEEQDQKLTDDAFELWRQHGAIWSYRVDPISPTTLTEGRYFDPQKHTFKKAGSGLIVPVG